MRYSTGWTNPPVRAQNTTEHLLIDPKVLKGMAHVHRLGLSFEAWLYYNQLHDVAVLAQKFPELPIVVNHIGGPLGVGAWEGKIEEVFTAWKPAITEIAKYPNVYMKVGGLGMGYLTGFGWEKRPKPPTSDELVEKNRRWWTTRSTRSHRSVACSRATSRRTRNRVRTRSFGTTTRSTRNRIRRRSARRCSTKQRFASTGCRAYSARVLETRPGAWPRDAAGASIQTSSHRGRKERTRRNGVMAEASRAYEEDDERKLRAILDDWR